MAADLGVRANWMIEHVRYLLRNNRESEAKTLIEQQKKSLQPKYSLWLKLAEDMIRWKQGSHHLDDPAKAA